eukprot:TRINITY_DN26655_c0_g1_i1.p1 TRINITY_DN26655_c0_g1~~TRINITY_DN26655_c0_g1_i1.p1  ORF type:complete len:251 (+),score=55.72 TRINITY_DN26655_c0_g1_i1:31-783(+)
MSDDIFTAAERNNVKRLEELIQDGADVNERDWDRGSTPLHFACAAGNLDAIETLLEYAADINAQNKHGRTPLHCLISERYDKIALWLIQYQNADPHIQDKRGVSSFDLAQRFFQPEIEAAIRNRVADAPEEEEEPLNLDNAAKEDIKIVTAKGVTRVVNINEYDTVADMINKMLKACNMPEQYARHFDILEVITKKVGTKRYKKQVILGLGDNVFEKKGAWPSNDDACYFLFQAKAEAPTKVHVSYTNLT